jgi:disulfide bond formation protein DsbB
MAMVFGSLFGCCGVFSAGGALVNRVMAPAMMQLPDAAGGQEPEFVAAQRRIMERSFALQARIFPYVITSGVLTLLHSLALVIAGIMAHNGRASGRRVLVLVCLVGIGVELITGGIGLYHAGEQGKLSEEMMKAAMVLPSSGEPTPEQKEAQQFMQSFAAGAGRASSILGWLMVIVFFATKVAYYVFSSIYLRRPEVVRHFEPASG